MGNYIPCRTGDDQDSHLYASGEQDRALCGKRVDSPSGPPNGRNVCVACAKRLLIRVFGQAGQRVLIEQFLDGEELTIMAFTDGRTVVPMLPARMLVFSQRWLGWIR